MSTLAFKISTPKLELEVTLEDIGKLRIHEEIIPKLLEELVEEIKSDGVLKHPVVVGKKTLTVLDGMHRVAALEEIGCKFAPVCLVDYQDPNVRVDRWDRFIQGVEIGEVLEVCEARDLPPEPVPVARARELLSKREIIAALLAKSGCYSLGGAAGEIGTIYRQIKGLETLLREGGLAVGYGTERDVLSKVGSEGGVGLLIPIARKKEVLNAAASGNVLPHKTTRHVIPVRPMMINTPLKWITSSERSAAEIGQAMEVALRKRGVKRLPPGVLFEGRRYEEELYVFR